VRIALAFGLFDMPLLGYIVSLFEAILSELEGTKRLCLQSVVFSKHPEPPAHLGQVDSVCFYLGWQFVVEPDHFETHVYRRHLNALSAFG
jgi:hypothetical protein